MTAGTSREAIRQAITARGISQEEAAALVDVSPITMSRWINGRQDPSFEKLDALAAALGQPIVLSFGTDAPEPEPPAWAERLLAGTLALEQKARVSDDELAEAEAQAVAFLAVAERRRRERSGGGGSSAASA